MKLKNKKTGEIAELIGMFHNDGRTFYRFKDEKGIFKQEVHSLLDLSEWWEDYEEPSKTIWQIEDSGELQEFEEDVFSDGYIESSKSIGNYFETEEEAEEAVEKLKAWKRLKDNSWEPVHYDISTREASVIFSTGYTITEQDRKDLDLLFGGEE